MPRSYSAHRGAAPDASFAPGRLCARLLIRAYQLTLSAFVGRQCRHLPTCSDYADEAIGRHGLWPGGWMSCARLCRCHPLGTHGFDPVPSRIAPDASWFRPWRYGRWCGCEPVPSQAELPESAN